MHLACERRLCHMGCWYQVSTKAGSPCARSACARPLSFSRRACLCPASDIPAVPDTMVRLATLQPAVEAHPVSKADATHPDLS